MNKKNSDLIRFIVCYATEQETALTTVRLVKFIYLADVYHARWHNGEQFTKLPWAFVYYGPYCSEVMWEIDEVVSAGHINQRSLESKYDDSKDFNLFTCKDEDSETFRARLPLAVVSELKEAIKKYGDETAALLDYVYFDTEPMSDAKKGDILDFSLAKRPERIQQIQLGKLSKEEITKAKEHVSRMKQRFEEGRKKLHLDTIETNRFKDSLYYSALEYMDEEDLEVGLTGVARIER